jgi:hypothetical protein
MVPAGPGGRRVAWPFRDSGLLSQAGACTPDMADGTAHMRALSGRLPGAQHLHRASRAST